MNGCDCSAFYMFHNRFQCLHQLFASGSVKILVRETTREGVHFYIYRDKPKEGSAAWQRGWWQNGARSRITARDEILLAIELASKYQVKKVRL